MNIAASNYDYFYYFFFSQMKLKLREDGENCSEQGSDKK